MLMQHIVVGYFGYYRATAYAMKHSLMPEIAKLRMKALNFWDKHGIRAAADAFDVSTRTLYWWRRLLRTGGPEALIPRSKAPLVRRSRHWHPDVLKEIRRLRTELPNLGKEQIFVRLKPWCEARHFTCPSTSTIGRIIAGAHDKMRMIPVRLSARGKARLIKKRSVKPRRPKQYRPVKTGELIGMDAIELRMGDLRRYIITMIDEHSDYALALAVPSLNSDITSHFFSKATKLFPVAIRQVVTDNGKEFLGNFDKTLQEASIKHIWTYPYTPKMNATCERFNRTLREQFIEFNELLLFEDLNLFNQRMAEYLVLYNSKRPHKSLELMTPVDYILRESKNCNMWWTHTILTAQCALLDEAVKGRGVEDEACLQWYDIPLQGHFLGTMDAGDTLCERMRDVLREPAPNLAVVTCFQRVMLLGFIGSFRSLHDPERLKLVNALGERVPPFQCPATAPVLVESRAGLGISGWLAPWPVRIGLSVVVVLALWWGLNHWLDHLLLTLLPGEVK